MDLPGRRASARSHCQQLLATTSNYKQLEARAAATANASPIRRRYITDTSLIHHRYVTDTSPIHHRYIIDTSLILL
eukprot:5214464-Pleurochrysis_carterae.AAC.1